MCNLIRETALDGDWSRAIKLPPRRNPSGGVWERVANEDGDELAERGDPRLSSLLGACLLAARKAHHRLSEARVSSE